MFRRPLIASIIVAVASAAVARAQQVPVGDPLEDYFRVLQVAGRAAPSSFVIRPLGLDAAQAALAADSTHPWQERLASLPTAVGLGRARFVLSEPLLRVFENSRFPEGQNDGAVWQGKGLTAALDAGGTLRWGALTVEVRPSLIFTQNGAFTLAPVAQPRRTIYADPWHPMPGQSASIDMPQRFGPSAFWTLDPGQSSIRFEARGLSAGVGTQNLWWGPGIQNAIIMSDNAPGFPHAWLGTSRPLNIGIGRFEGQWIWGRLRNSGWSDSARPDTTRFLTGMVLSFEPKPLPGLYLGATRLFYETIPGSGLGVRDYLLVFQGILKAELASPQNPSGNDRRDQMLSIFARWLLPASGFEVYAEWARNDHNWDFRDFLLEPEHSQAYTLGLQKVLQVSGGRLMRLGGELTHLERDVTLQVRATPPYYAHYVVRDGYTQRGQVIGAGIGPGGNAQRVWADVFARWGRIGGFLARQVHDNDAYYAITGDTISFGQHDVTLQAGLSALVLRGAFDLGGALVASRELNRYFLLRNDLTNLHLEMSVRWRPGRR